MNTFIYPSSATYIISVLLFFNSRLSVARCFHSAEGSFALNGMKKHFRLDFILYVFFSLVLKVSRLRNSIVDDKSLIYFVVAGCNNKDNDVHFNCWKIKGLMSSGEAARN